MAFEFQIPADSVSDSVFLGARHLNLMDKIISHVIQMNSNPRFQIPGSRIQGPRIRRSWTRRSLRPQTHGSRRSRTRESRRSWIRVLGLGSEKWSRRLGA
jgi:hypothetical protein